MEELELSDVVLDISHYYTTELYLYQLVTGKRWNGDYPALLKKTLQKFNKSASASLPEWLEMLGVEEQETVADTIALLEEKVGKSRAGNLTFTSIIQAFKARDKTGPLRHVTAKKLGAELNNPSHPAHKWMKEQKRKFRKGGKLPADIKSGLYAHI